jgi:hypothetical protein
MQKHTTITYEKGDTVDIFLDGKTYSGIVYHIGSVVAYVDYGPEDTGWNAMVTLSELHEWNDHKHT